MPLGKIESVLSALIADQVRFVVVGGVAVVLQGFPRLTLDLDLVVDLEPVNVRRAMATLERLEFRPKVPVAAASFADRDVRESWIRDKQMRVFSLWSDRFRGTDIDIFVAEPIPFEELWRAADRLPLAAASVPVASIDHLLRLKRAAGRGRDLEDIEALEQIQHERGETGG